MNEPLVAFAAGTCFAATIGLALFVSKRTPTRLDILGTRLQGRGVLAARFFTFLGRWYAIAAIAGLIAIFDIATGRAILPIAALLVAEVAGQGAVSLIKAVVHRTRPALWLVRLEPDSSFPSGHATTAIVYFVGMMVLTGTSDIARAIAIPAIVVLAICAVGIPWSRLVLGAHYATDVVGGLAFGSGWLLASLGIFAHFAEHL